MERIDLPMTIGEGMILWGVLDRIIADREVQATLSIDRRDATMIGWTRERLAKLCMGIPVLTVPPEAVKK